MSITLDEERLQRPGHLPGCFRGCALCAPQRVAAERARHALPVSAPGLANTWQRWPVVRLSDGAHVGDVYMPAGRDVAAEVRETWGEGYSVGRWVAVAGGGPLLAVEVRHGV